MSTPNETPAVNPYLFFEGSCDQALEFYRSKLGAEVVSLMRFKDSPDPSTCATVPGDKVMHASFRIAGSLIMASDGRCSGKANFQGFALSLTVRGAAEADRAFAALAEGGEVQMPLAQAFFSPRFGMVADRFGVSWMVYVTP